MKKYFCWLVFILAACGTVLDETPQVINIDSNIAGIDIYIDSIKVCRTPCSYFTKHHSGNVFIEAKKDNHLIAFGYIGSEMTFRSINQHFSDIYQYSKHGIYVETEKDKNHLSQNRLIRHYTLINFAELKLEAAKNQGGEFISGLSELIKKNKDALIKIINDNDSEIKLAHALTGIKFYK